MNYNENIEEQRQNIIAKLVEARLEKGITQAQLAKMIGTQRSNICRLEGGTQNPSLDTLLKISAALGKNIEFDLISNFFISLSLIVKTNDFQSEIVSFNFSILLEI